MEKILKLFKKERRRDRPSLEKLPGPAATASTTVCAVPTGKSVVGCIGTSRDENHAFICLSRHFTRRQLPVPQVLAASDDELRYLQTDLGTVSLFDAIRGGREAGGRYTLKEQELLKRTIRELPNMQMRGARGLDFSNCYPQPAFDRTRCSSTSTTSSTVS